MTIKPLYLIIATIFLALAIWFGLDRNSKYKSEKAAREVLEEKIIDTEAENNRLRDSVQISIKNEVSQREGLEKRLDSIEKIKTTPRYDKSIDRVNDADSISDLFTRNYPNK